MLYHNQVIQEAQLVFVRVSRCKVSKTKPEGQVYSNGGKEIMDNSFRMRRRKQHSSIPDHYLGFNSS